MTLRAAALLAIVGSTAAAGCAHVEAPPGGLEDRTPPGVLSITPAPEAVVPEYDGPVVFLFDERISERGIDEGLVVSPRTSPVVVSRGRDQIRVSLRGGWEPNVIYHVTIRPGLQDLFGNAIAEPISLVFSTGPPIPATLLGGTVVDRLTGRPEADVRVEAVRLADSLVYAGPTNASGAFSLDQIPEGEYRIRAFRDLNQNREIDPFEARDSALVSVAVGRVETAGLRLLMPDSTPPMPTSAALRQDRIEVQFDDYLDEGQAVDGDQVDVLDGSGGSIPLSRIGVGALLAPPGAAPPPTPAVPDVPAPPGPVDPGTPTLPEPPASAGSLPSRTLTLELDAGAELDPGATYRVVVRGMRNVHGLTGGGEVEMVVPAGAPNP